ncbi:protein kinase domain-containing protein [Pendulispora albinea]|uniref:Protein kinase n=1 Tax=Pendulispora albinea TaxID=2741071 RepID=A0ABZ2MA44_9BACT
METDNRFDTSEPPPLNVRERRIETAAQDEHLHGAIGTRFELMERLGVGGTAEVFLARDTLLDRTVAIKFLIHEALGTTEALHRIRLEAQACARLNHENIVRLFDIGRDMGVPFLVMEHLQGRTLDTMMCDERIDARRAVRILIDVARGLSHAHRAGIVHRDLKPSNVFIAKDGTAKILDFGVAMMTARPDVAHDGLLGTPRYMSPEQWTGEAQDGRTDIWAAGVMLFELLTGRLPFDGGHLVELRDAVVSPHPAPSLREVRPDLPEEAERIVQRTMKKDAAERFGTADELLDSLIALELALTHAMRLEHERGEELARPKPERRQMTVVSCSLDAPAFPGERGLDAIGESLDEFVDVCMTVLRELGGTFLSFWGARVIACFGYPTSYEDDAHRALRAASLILDVMRDRARADGSARTVRIGIGTSLAIAGRLESATAPLILQGDAPHIAQWLEQRSGPNEILVGEATHLLVRSAFELEPRGEAIPTAGTRPTRIYRLLGSRDAASRFDPIARGTLTPLVGRDGELEALRVLWEAAKARKGRFVLIAGEAGIGKSRLLERHLEEVATGPHAIVRCQCWPHLQNSALQPIADGLARIMGLRSEASPAEKLQLLEMALTAAHLSLEEYAPLLAAFMRVPAGELYPLPPLTPDLLKKRTLAALVTLFTRLASAVPLSLVVEDAHWSDSSTLELLDMVLDGIVATRAMVIVTARTELQPPWPQRPHLHRLVLERLSSEESATLIALATEDYALPPRIVQQLVERTDGVPLFIEELTHTVADALREAEQHDGAMDIEALAPSMIPETLEGLLRARLDSLPREGRDVAGLIAVLGRDASYDLIHEAWGASEGSLRMGLMQLLETATLRQQGHGAEARYTFKHALVKEAAYRSLVKTKRRELHQRAAEVLIARARGLVEQHPELVAGHFVEAGCHEQAVAYFDKAGHRAIQRLSHVDSAAHFGHALEQLRMLPKSPARDRHELALEFARRTALMADEVGLSPDLARQLATQAEQSNDSAMAVYAHSAVGLSALMAGDFAISRSAARAALVAFDVRTNDPLTPYCGFHPIVLSDVCLLWSDGLRGQWDRAVDHGRNAIQHARDDGDAFSLAFGLVQLASWYNYRGQFDEGRRLIDEAAPYCKGDVAALMASKINRGWCRVAAGDRAGIHEIEEGVTEWCNMGVTLGLTSFFSVLARAQLGEAALDDAMHTIDRAMDLVETKGQRFFEAELLRIRGEILLASGDAPSRVFDCFERGLEVARRQQAKVWELRLAHSYAHLLKIRARPADARRRLAPILAQFTEGFATADMREARALLAAL